jgi:hypothetical protein
MRCYKKPVEVCGQDRKWPVEQYWSPATPKLTGDWHCECGALLRLAEDTCWRCYKPKPDPKRFDAESIIERMCRAYWPAWDRMRPDNQRKWRAKMHAVLAVVKES